MPETNPNELPVGVALEAGHIVVNGDFTFVRLHPGFVAVAQPSTADMRILDTHGFVTCECSGEGKGCVIVLKSIGPHRAEIACESDGCKGSCNGYVAPKKVVTSAIEKLMAELHAQRPPQSIEASA